MNPLVKAPLPITMLLLALLLGSCGSRQTVGLESPWRETDTPDDIALLADDMLAYRTVNAGRLPATLSVLDASGISTAGPYGERAFAYHPDGIGILDQGWRLLLVDDRLREKDHVWCIVRPPVRIGKSRSLRVVLVPMAELQVAAINANGTDDA